MSAPVVTALPHLPAVSATEAALLGLGGAPVHSRRVAVRLLNALHEAGWALERTPEGEEADRIAELTALAAEADADGDHADAAWFRARIAHSSSPAPEGKPVELV